jgi:hypothetical protein
MSGPTNDARKITDIAKNQFDSSYQMLETLVEVCPDDIWYDRFNGIPFWYQVYHTAYFVDYWFRDHYTQGEFRSMEFDERIPPEFEHEIDPGLSISREDMREYIARIHIKTARILGLWDDAALGRLLEGQDGYTRLDVVMTQNRHIMYNIGYLNGILRSRGAGESDWYAYNENDG